jgi:hypothetical protein
MKKLLLLVIPAIMFWGNTTYAQTALKFDGVDDYVNAGNNFALTSYTKEVWVKWDGITGQNNVISGDLSNPHAFWAVGGNMRAGHGSPFSTVGDGEDWVPDVWYHFAVSYNGTTGEMKFYEYGVLTEQNLDDPGFVLTQIYLAAFPVEGDLNQLGGTMDDVRIWDHVRTDEEIAANYDACLNGTEEGLVAFYDFEDGPGSDIVADLTGNGNDGTLVNMDIDNAWVEGVNCGDDPVDPDPIEITNFYPNPTWNRVYLNLNDSYDRLQVRVYNRYGRFVRGKNVYRPTDHTFATLYGLRRGYYYVMVIDRDTWEYDYVRVYKRGWY